jgi:hypothetical protein
MARQHQHGFRGRQYRACCQRSAGIPGLVSLGERATARAGAEGFPTLEVELLKVESVVGVRDEARGERNCCSDTRCFVKRSTMRSGERGFVGHA